jgi:hypothetical protein
MTVACSLLQPSARGLLDLLISLLAPAPRPPRAAGARGKRVLRLLSTGSRQWLECSWVKSPPITEALGDRWLCPTFVHTWTVGQLASLTSFACGKANHRLQVFYWLGGDQTCGTPAANLPPRLD